MSYNLSTSRVGVLFRNIAVSQLIKKFPTFYRMCTFTRLAPKPSPIMSSIPQTEQYRKTNSYISLLVPCNEHLLSFIASVGIPHVRYTHTNNKY
jgi:hypothetical protein